MPRIAIQHATVPLRRCAECGQHYTPFPVRESRLCAPCVYRAVTRWGDVVQRRRILEAALRVGASGAEPLLRALAEALEALPAVRRCTFWICADTALEPASQRPSRSRRTPALHLLARLDGCTFVRDLAAKDPALGRTLRGWTLVAPLRAGTRLLGIVAVAERRERRLARPADVELFAAVAAAASAGLERQRLLRETARLGGALERLERMEALGTVAAGTAHEIQNALLAARTLLDAEDGEDAARLRALGIRHLHHALHLSESLTALAPPADRPALAPEVAAHALARQARRQPHADHAHAD